MEVSNNIAMNTYMNIRKEIRKIISEILKNSSKENQDIGKKFIIPKEFKIPEYSVQIETYKSIPENQTVYIYIFEKTQSAEYPEGEECFEKRKIIISTDEIDEDIIKSQGIYTSLESDERKNYIIFSIYPNSGQRKIKAVCVYQSNNNGEPQIIRETLFIRRENINGKPIHYTIHNPDSYSCQYSIKSKKKLLSIDSIKGIRDKGRLPLIFQIAFQLMKEEQIQGDNGIEIENKL